MSAADPRRGRRDNGLVAAAYAAVGDVDPRVGEHLLDVLALDGIAAYLRPSGDLHPVTRTALLPDRPTDRLFVDREHLAQAREYLARLAAEAAQDETDGLGGSTDEVWAQIVARYDAEVEPRDRPWPAAEDLHSEEPAADGAPAEARPERTRHLLAAGEDTAPAELARIDPPVVEGSLLDGLDTFGADLPDESDEGYTPPPPPPLPRPAVATVLAVVGVIGGLIVFLKPGLLPMAEGTATVLGFAAIIAGFATLVLRLRPGDDDEDDDPDNGARV